jgi:hypothetical protein
MPRAFVENINNGNGSGLDVQRAKVAFILLDKITKINVTSGNNSGERNSERIVNC